MRCPGAMNLMDGVFGIGTRDDQNIGIEFGAIVKFR